MARKFSRRERRFLQNYRKLAYKRWRKLRPEYPKYRIEECVDFDIRHWAEGKAATSFINKRWRRTIRAYHDWSWLSRPGGLLIGSPNHSGHRYICCIFHEERTPSLWLHRDGGFYCFGCQASGDIVDIAIHVYRLKTVRDVKRFFELDGVSPGNISGQPATPLARGGINPSPIMEQAKPAQGKLF